MRKTKHSAFCIMYNLMYEIKFHTEQQWNDIFLFLHTGHALLKYSRDYVKWQTHIKDNICTRTYYELHYMFNIVIILIIIMMNIIIISTVFHNKPKNFCKIVLYTNSIAFLSFYFNTFFHLQYKVVKIVN